MHFLVVVNIKNFFQKKLALISAVNEEQSYSNPDRKLIEEMQISLNCIAEDLTANQRLFAGLILRNLRTDEVSGCNWILASLGFNKLPTPETPVHKAVEEISSYSYSMNIERSENMIASVSLLKALNQYSDLLAATDFLQKASDIFSKVAAELQLAFGLSINDPK